MRSAIEFNDQATFRTIEIDNVRTYATLSAKFVAQELSALKICPQKGFRGR
jgi:hypothetical protein